MADQDFSEKVESTIIGIVQFALRLGRTLLHLIIKPRRLLAEVRNNFAKRQYLAPHAYLLSCAIALGFFGKILAQGLDRVGFDAWESIKELTFSSFLNHSVPVFLIAIAAALLVEILLFVSGQFLFRELLHRPVHKELLKRRVQIEQRQREKEGGQAYFYSVSLHGNR